MLNNNFIIKTQYLDIDEIVSENPNTISTNKPMGNVTLITNIGHLQINIDAFTKKVLSIDGIIGIPEIESLNDNIYTGALKASLVLINNKSL